VDHPSRSPAPDTEISPATVIQPPQVVASSATRKEDYHQWRQGFLWRRLQLTLRLGFLAYLTFIGLRLILTASGILAWDQGWFSMAISVELWLLIWLLVNASQRGRRRPELAFLATSWGITLSEQIWATLRGEAFIGLFAWTLVFVTQATLMPVRWPLHLASQLGLFVYFFGVNRLLGLESTQTFWDPTLWLYLFWFCGICDLSVYLYERLQRAEFYARRALEAEQKKSEELLLNILPEAVAEQLKKEQRTIAEHFPEVTVLFADIVGFTRLSAGIPPNEVVTLLNDIFSVFDRLAEMYGLEKIKTIGDAYMVVGGLPVEKTDHVEAIARMALDMKVAIAQVKHDKYPSFSMRIGIHTGPVVAGVIGVKKFIYDLWGDTVNIASRMESHGIPGEIQVSQAVYDRLRDYYVFEPRGAIPIKGKGEMVTYLLRGRR
jgi:class 3 adenylate cyclase